VNPQTVLAALQFKDILQNGGVGEKPFLSGPEP
jgi:hypothetical protein